MLIPFNRKLNWRHAAKLLLFVAGIFISLEVTARLYNFGWDSFNFRKVNSFHDVGRAGLLRISDDPDISHELKPNVDTYLRSARFVTNSQGFRDREYSLSKPPLTFRTVVVGASYVMGSGVELDDTFHSVLENHLNREKRNMTYEFINMGVAGQLPWHSLAVVKKRALSYEPDLILFATTPYMYNSGPRPRLRKLKSVSYPFFNSYFGLLLELQAKTWLKALRGKKKPPKPGKVKQVRERINATVSELKRIEESSGVPVCLVVLEHRDQYLEWKKEIAASARDHGVKLIDASEPFVRAGFAGFCTHPLDCHPNPRAHAIFAGVIHDFLSEKHLLESVQQRKSHVQ